MERHHNFLDISVHRPVLNGEEPGTLPVDARCDVVDGFVGGELPPESILLPREVVPLRGAGDSAVSGLGH